MYYIYEVFGVKIGCTDNPVRRVEKQQGYSPEQYTILESYTDIKIASEREKELQLEKGYPQEISTYENIIKRVSEISDYRRGKPGKLTIPWTYTPEAIQNRINNSPLKQMGEKTSKRQKGKIQPQFLTEESKKKAIENRKKKVAAYFKDGSLFKVFNSPTDAALELNVKRGIIYDTLSGRQKTSRGYIWKYV
jgi:hypothetical protein